jgi:hypothetical protein
MNASPSNQLHIKIVTENNPWEDTEHLPSLPTLTALVWCLVSIVCSMYPAVASVYPQLWFVPLLCAALFYLRANRTPYGWILLVLTFGGVFLLSGSLPAASSALCLLTTISLTGFLYSATRHPLLICLPVIAYAGAVVLCTDPLLSLLTLPPYAAAYILGNRTMKNEGRVGVIAETSLIFGGALIAVLALLWRLSGAEISADSVTAIVSQTRAMLLDTALNHAEFEEVRRMMSELGYPLEQILALSFDLLVTLLPAVAIIAVFFLCYAAQYLCVTAFAAMGMPRFFTINGRRFLMSILSALLFVACAIISLFPSAEISLFRAVIQNLFFILFPGMLVAGFWSLYASYRARPAPFYLLLAIVLCCFVPHILLIFIALSGAITTLTRPLLLKIMALTQQSNGDNNNNNDNNQPPQNPS